ncbi:MAG: NADH:ubiquinone reductase (Na(+)-transporting) subunit B [Bacteroidales bacterium]|nr:NADH:ubiquinone reductase (Na(+)-transporting) subunit B [Bacteroidales bacterium]
MTQQKKPLKLRQALSDFFIASKEEQEGTARDRVRGLRRYVSKIKPNFVEGGRFAWLQSTFEAFESFLFVPDETTKQGCQIRDAIDLKRTMITVVIALMPALLFGIWNVGYQHFNSLAETAGFWQMIGFGLTKALPVIVVSYVTGLAIEFAFAQIRHHQVNEGFLVTGLLIPMVLPPDIPLWMVAVATAFAVLIGKEAFGGTGMNLVNPALLARAFLFFAFPSVMSGDKVWIAGQPDAFTGATPLGILANGGTELPSALTMLWGGIPGCLGETSVIAIALGAILLLVTGIASWRIMLSVIIGGGLMGLTFNLLSTLNLPQPSTLNPQLSTYLQLPFYYHYLMGGFMFGAVFMATDPVTAAQTNVGKWVYGLLIGIFAVMLRVINPAYPEGMMLAILLMNCFAPLIDHCVIARNIRMRQKRALVTTKASSK